MNIINDINYYDDENDTKELHELRKRNETENDLIKKNDSCAQCKIF